MFSQMSKVAASILQTDSFELYMKKQYKHFMNVSIPFSFKGGSSSSNTSLENYTATEASQ